MTTRQVLMITASCLIAAMLNADFASGALSAQTADRPMSKTCRVGPRSRGQDACGGRSEGGRAEIDQAYRPFTMAGSLAIVKA
jgi:hypothetical protein